MKRLGAIQGNVEKQSSGRASLAASRGQLTPKPSLKRARYEEYEDTAEDEEEGGEEEERDEGDEDMDKDAAPTNRKGQMEDDIMQQVADDIPFEVLMELKKDGSGPSGKAARDAAKMAQERAQSLDFKRANRHRPSEMSSKKPVSRFREVIQVTKKESLDPRFVESRMKGGKDDNSSAVAAASAYRFLYDEIIPSERKELKERLLKEKNPKFRARVQSQLTKLDQAMNEAKAKAQRTKVLQEIKAKEKAEVAAGKKPYFLKKSEQRKLELLAKFNELKAAGGDKLEKFMEKRRKKNASKDHRFIPGQRREGED